MALPVFSLMVKVNVSHVLWVLMANIQDILLLCVLLKLSCNIQVCYFFIVSWSNKMKLVYMTYFNIFLSNKYSDSVGGRIQTTCPKERG